jgi:adenylate kinase
MARGELVSDDLVIALLKEQMKLPGAQKGLLLDGFPRTVAQAEALDAMMQESGLSIDQVVEMKVDEAVLEERVTGRWIHKPSGRPYHVKFNPPKEDGKDDVTGEALYQRPDDTADALETRLEAYRSQTAPILEYYEKQGKLATVDATDKMDNVQKVVASILTEVKSRSMLNSLVESGQSDGLGDLARQMTRKAEEVKTIVEEEEKISGSPVALDGGEYNDDLAHMAEGRVGDEIDPLQRKISDALAKQQRRKKSTDLTSPGKINDALRSGGQAKEESHKVPDEGSDAAGSSRRSTRGRKGKGG